MISKLRASVGFISLVLPLLALGNAPQANGKEETTKAAQEAKPHTIKASKNGGPITPARIVKQIDILSVKGLYVGVLAHEKKSGELPSQNLIFTAYSRDPKHNIDLAFDLGPIHCLHAVQTLDNALYQAVVTAPGAKGKPVMQEIEIDAAAGTFIPMSDVTCSKFPCPAAEKFAAQATISVRTNSKEGPIKACP